MDYTKKFNKCCKLLYKSWAEKTPCKEVFLVLNAFQVLKTIDKQMPLNFFIDTLVPLSERIKQKDITVIDVFMSKNIMYSHLTNGIMKSWYSLDTDFQNHIWDQVSILLQLAQLFVSSSN
jgi:hypothetical protein